MSQHKTSETLGVGSSSLRVQAIPTQQYNVGSGNIQRSIPTHKCNEVSGNIQISIPTQECNIGSGKTQRSTDFIGTQNVSKDCIAMYLHGTLFYSCSLQQQKNVLEYVPNAAPTPTSTRNNVKSGFFAPSNKRVF